MILFEDEIIQASRERYQALARWNEIQYYQKIQKFVGRVKNIFCGDSITEQWPLQEFFPNFSVLNRGMNGNDSYTVYDRLVSDVLAYKPERVFLQIGFHDLQGDLLGYVARMQTIANLLLARGISVYIASLLPVKTIEGGEYGEYQNRIIRFNTALKELTRIGDMSGYIDYHSILCDARGQLSDEYGQADGVNVTLEAYHQMSMLVKQLLRC